MECFGIALFIAGNVLIVSYRVNHSLPDLQIVNSQLRMHSSLSQSEALFEFFPDHFMNEMLYLEPMFT